MDINVTVKLTGDEYMTKLMFAAIEFFENLKECQTPLASVPNAEITPAPAPIPTPAPEPIPAPVPATAIPVAPAKQYTKDELMMAASQLMDSNPNNQAALVALLPKYGVKSFMELQPDQYGAFATDLRALGGRL